MTGATRPLSAPISDTTWVQWVRDWDATPGEHQIMVRATDGNGVVQTEERTPAGTRRRARLAHHPGQGRLTARTGHSV